MEDRITLPGHRRKGTVPDRTSENVSENDPSIRYGTQVEIGAGAMGDVFRVRDSTLNREVAMKVLKKSIASKDSVNRFHVEAQIGSQLEHSGLLPIHDLGQNEEGSDFFTMRYVPAHQTLEKIIEKLREGDPESHERFCMEERVQIIVRIADTLSYIHQRGVLHRDIKPANILIGDSGDVYLVDLGVATLRGSDNGDTVTTTVQENAVEEGELVGTVLYMSPEQLLGEKFIDAASDVYSLSAVAYEFFSTHHYLGKKPPSSYFPILTAVLEEDRIDAERYWDPHRKNRVPRQLSRILRRGLNKKRESALKSADELGAALRAWLEGRAPIVCPGTFIQRCLGWWSRAIDRYPVIAPVLTLTSVSIVAFCALFTANTYLRIL